MPGNISLLLFSRVPYAWAATTLLELPDPWPLMVHDRCSPNGTLLADAMESGNKFRTEFSNPIDAAPQHHDFLNESYIDEIHVSRMVPRRELQPQNPGKDLVYTAAAARRASVQLSRYLSLTRSIAACSVSRRLLTPKTSCL